MPDNGEARACPYKCLEQKVSKRQDGHAPATEQVPTLQNSKTQSSRHINCYAARMNGASSGAAAGSGNAGTDVQGNTTALPLHASSKLAGGVDLVSTEAEQARRDPSLCSFPTLCSRDNAQT